MNAPIVRRDPKYEQKEDGHAEYRRIVADKKRAMKRPGIYWLIKPTEKKNYYLHLKIYNLLFEDKI